MQCAELRYYLNSDHQGAQNFGVEVKLWLWELGTTYPAKLQPWHEA